MASQECDQSEGEVHPRRDASTHDQIAIPHDTILYGYGSEFGQEIVVAPMGRHPAPPEQSGRAARIS